MTDRFALLGRLASGVAHDLNNYLAVVELSLSILQRRIADPELWRDLKLARAALDSATRLNRTLLEYARGGNPEREAVNLIDLVRRVVGLFGGLIPSVIVTTVEAAGAAPPVLGVRAELEQLVLNLVLNACDAMPEGGQLRLTVSAAAGGVTLEVADTGSGVTDEVRLGKGATSPSSKTGRDGGGLGIGIVRSVAERHDAAVALAARGGGGTLVSVCFARACAAA